MTNSFSDFPLFNKIYELYQLLHHYHPNIPKSQRYTIWQKCENLTLELLELVVATSHCAGEQRLKVLEKFSYKLDLFKVFTRLAKDTRTLDNKHYEQIQAIVFESGKMIGGWIKSLKN